jgi:hypothetical protein|tara:strand:- start:660 stop:1265 length:606 start_codon:yes stop_codon:yes gene_type:complete
MAKRKKVQPIEDYRKVEEFARTKKGKQLAARERAQKAREVSRQYRYKNNLKTTKLKGPAMSDGTYTKNIKGKPYSYGTVTSSDQIVTAKGNKGLSGAGVSGSKNPVYDKTPKSFNQPSMSKTVSEKLTKKNVAEYTAKSVGMSVKEYSKYKAVAKIASKAASRLIPGVGTAMIAKDIYDFSKWAAKQPKKSTKPYKYGSNY